LQHKSAAFAPAFLLAQDPDDRSSGNRERFMVRPYDGPDSSSTWQKISGAGHWLDQLSEYNPDRV
jgi:hypothetical protein